MFLTMEDVSCFRNIEYSEMIISMYGNSIIIIVILINVKYYT